MKLERSGKVSRNSLTIRLGSGDLAGLALGITVLLLIAFLPSARGVNLDIQGLGQNQQVPQDGGAFQFDVVITIATNERIPLQEVRVILDGQTLRYSLTGTQITSSQTIPSLTLLTPPSAQLYSSQYGYDYGYFQAYGYSFSDGYSYSYGSSSAYGYGFGSVSGPVTLKYRVTVYPNLLSAGSHSVRVDILTGLSPQSTFSSQTISFSILSPSPTPPPVLPPPPVPSIPGAVVVETTIIVQPTAVVDNTATTGVAVSLEGLTFVAGQQGRITTAKYIETPATTVTIQAAVGAAPVKYVDVVATNIVSGTATINVTYTSDEIKGKSENDLTLYYYTGSSWVELSNVVVNIATKVVTGKIEVTKLTGTIVSLATKGQQLGSVTLSNAGTTLAIDEGDTVTFTATATFDDGTPAATVAIKVLQNNAQVTTATTGNDGKATFTLTFPQAGTYTIAVTGELAGVQKTSSAATVIVSLKQVNSALSLERAKLQPGSSLKVTLILDAKKALEQGNLSFTLPSGFTVKDVSTTGFPGTVTMQNNILTIQKTTATTSTSQATITFTLVSPVTGLQAGQTLTISASIDIKGFRTNFTTDSSLQITIQKPSVDSLLSILDSYFDQKASIYTQDRVPTVTDILALLDIFFGA